MSDEKKTIPATYFPVTGKGLDTMAEPLRIFLEHLGDYNFGEELRGVAVVGLGKMQAQYGWSEVNNVPKFAVDFDIRGLGGQYVEIPFAKGPNDKTPLTEAYNMAVEDAFRIVEAQVAEYDTGDDGFGAGAAILDLWKGIKPKREPFLVSDKEEVISPPKGVYYDIAANDFVNGEGGTMGGPFFATWIKHCGHFIAYGSPSHLGEMPESDDPAATNEGIDIVARPRTPEEQAERNAQFMGGRGDEVWD